MELVYKDLILRSISEEDTDDILKWRNSEHVRKYFIYQEEIKKGSFKLVEKQGGCRKCDSVYDSEKRGSLSGWFGVFKGY